MKIEFIKDHPSGIAKGKIHDVKTLFGERMIDEGFAKEFKAKKEVKKK